MDVMQQQLRRRIEELWPLRNEYFGCRLMLRAWIKTAKQLRSKERL